MEKIEHIPVLKDQVMEYLTNALPDNPVVLDCTVGFGGHSEEFAKAVRLKKGLLIAVDVDETALSKAEQRLRKYKKNIKFVVGNFFNIKEILESEGIDKVNALLADLGVSSMQLDNPERGFSFTDSGPLDMRMGKSIVKTAKDIVNTYTFDELYDVIKEYGEERWTKRIAQRIISARENKSIETTGELEEIVFRAIPVRFRKNRRIHPATRTFQALRMETNDELASLELLLNVIPDILVQGARAAIISFHSLEDRMVKLAFREMRKAGHIDIITKKPIVADEEEISKNKRSRSAKMRVAEKR
ncbi:16S rRNA (cytosine(1402)-N(4))-methyltransferase RsmH [bacterium]|nr:16S rRNA (cytosine(1402)-N(4))-methyltransferase RsmH [bacterium]